MRTLQIPISDIEFNKFGIKTENLSFSDLLEVLSKELMCQNLNKCIELAEKFGLSKMKMADITKEVKAVRKNYKS